MAQARPSKLLTEDERKMLIPFPPPFHNAFAYFIQTNQVPCFVRFTQQGPEKRSLNCTSVFYPPQLPPSLEQTYTAETNPNMTNKIHIRNKLLIAAMHPKSTMTFEQVFNINTGEEINYGEKKLNPSVDHIDGNPTNDATINLRVVPTGENSSKSGPKQDGARNPFYYYIGAECPNPDDMSVWQFSEYAKHLDWLKPYNSYLFKDGDSQTIQALLGTIKYMQIADGLEDSRCWIHPKDIEKRLSIKIEFKQSGAVEILSHPKKGRIVLVDKNGFILRFGEENPKRGLAYKARDSKVSLLTSFDATYVAALVYGAFAPKVELESKADSEAFIRTDYKHDCTTGVKIFPCDNEYEVNPLDDPVDVSFLDYLEAHEYAEEQDDAKLKMYVRPLYTNEFNSLFPKDSLLVYDEPKAKLDYEKLKSQGLHTYKPGESQLTDAMAIYFHLKEHIEGYKQKTNTSCEVIDNRPKKRAKI